MAIECTEQERRLTVHLTGEIDHHAARSIMLALDGEIAARFPREVVLDFSGVSFMDSSGIAVVLRTCRRMQEVGGKLRAVNVPEQAAKVLRAAGVERMVPLTYLRQRREQEATL